jgi:hypothetical protein
MTKKQIDSIYKLIFGSTFLIVAGINTILSVITKESGYVWTSNICLFISILHIFLAGFSRSEQKYDETGKPL